MNAFLLAITIAVPQQELDVEAFVKKFDEAMSLAVATRLLLDEAFLRGPEPILQISTVEHDLIIEFGLGLPVWKKMIIDNNGEALFDQLNKAIKIDYIDLEVARAIIEREDYLSDMHDMGDHILSIRKYVEQTSAEKIVSVGFPVGPGEILRWFLFFKISKDNKWRLDFACPQIVIHTTSASAEVVFFYVPPVGVEPTTLTLEPSCSNPLSYGGMQVVF